MPEPETNSDNHVKAVVSDNLLALLDSEIAQAQDRQLSLARDAEIANVKNQIVGEYRVRFMDLRDKLRAKLSEANDLTSG